MSCHIVITGIDGSGKSTQVGRLSETLKKQGYSVATVEILNHQDKKVLDRWSEQFDDLAITFVYEALHRQKFVETVRALEGNSVVISDRWSESFDVHHGIYGPLKDMPILRRTLKSITFENKMPDIGFLLDIDPRICQSRMQERGMSFFDQRGIEYFQSIRRSLLAYANANKWAVLQGEQEEEVLTKTISSKVVQLLQHTSH